jgi:hypothetical protein
MTCLTILIFLIILIILIIFQPDIHIYKISYKYGNLLTTHYTITPRKHLMSATTCGVDLTTINATNNPNMQTSTGGHTLNSPHGPGSN